MTNSGIDTNIFKPNSCRGASTSAAKNEGVPIEQVLKQGQWSNCMTFFKYYYRDIEPEQLSFANE